MNILNTTIELINTDEKQLDILNYPEKIFLLGYNYNIIEKQIKNIYIKDKLSFNEFYDLIKEEDFYSIFLYLQKINNYYLEIIGKYSI